MFLRAGLRNTFDENMQIKHSSRPMRIIYSIVGVFLGFVITVDAQPANQSSRVMSVQDCILQALKHNLDVQIERYAPIIDQFNLNGAYGAYEPAFRFSATEKFIASPGGFSSASGLAANPNQTYVESFSSGLGGLLPSGLVKCHFLVARLFAGRAKRAEDRTLHAPA